MRSRLFAAIAASATIGPCALAQTVDPFYESRYTLADLGPVPGVPTPYGGLTLKFDDVNTLLIGGDANDAAGALYSIQVVRDSEGQITGFSGTAARFADAAFNDGGVIYGPSAVLFLARWPANEFGQTRPGSTATDRIIDLKPFGVENSVSAMNFVPPGYRGGGKLKFVTWDGGQWNDVVIAPGAGGTFDVLSVTEVPASRLPGGPEGFVYVPAASPLFPDEAMLLSAWSDGQIYAFDVDENGDPIVSTQRTFVADLVGAEGAFIDPVTGDFLFSTFGGGDHVIAIRGLNRPCNPDINGDGILDTRDFFEILNRFFAGDPRADYNADGVVNSQDIFAWLNDFFNGCP